MNKKIVYISHDMSGDVHEKMESLTRIIRNINLKFPDVIPVAPYYSDFYTLNDNNPLERKRGIDNSISIIESGMFQEIWITGNKLTSDMQDQVRVFMLQGKPVLNYVNKI